MQEAQAVIVLKLMKDYALAIARASRYRAVSGADELQTQCFYIA
jgi:hypothetical protein